MTPGKKPSKSEATRDRVIQAAIDCIYRDGFHAAHTNRIAEQAGVSWGVLQYHFGDKDGLLQAVIDRIFDDFTATLESTLRENTEMAAARDQRNCRRNTTVASTQVHRNVPVTAMPYAAARLSDVLNARTRMSTPIASIVFTCGT